MTAGFIYVGDGANPYAKNFMRAQEQVRETFGSRVRYIAKYNIPGGQEETYIQELLDEGCVIISQHSDTTGPSAACEESQKPYTVYHVSYNQSMKNVAPTTSLIGCRINWGQYEVAAVKAVLEGKSIEKILGEGVTVNGTDAGAGFSKGWVEMLELNAAIAPADAAMIISDRIQDFQKGRIQIFTGDYTGRDPFDPTDTVDLKKGYQENAHASSPSFHYVLDDVIEVE